MNSLKYKGVKMAFKINRLPNEDEQTNTCCECDNIDELHPEVVATHGWVFRKFGEFKAMLCKFENILETKLLKTDEVRTNEIITDHIMSKKFILIDDDGNKMELKIKDGNLVAEPV